MQCIIVDTKAMRSNDFGIGNVTQEGGAQKIELVSLQLLSLPILLNYTGAIIH